MRNSCAIASVKWQPPPLEVVKPNFDATFKPVSGEVTFGVVVHNSYGEVMEVSFRNFGHVLSSFATKASVTIHAIKLVGDLGIMKAIFEGDCLSVIKKLKANVRDLFDICALIWDAKSKVSNLLACSFPFVLRVGNQAAHLLASIGFDADRFWVDDSPSSLDSILVAERRNFEPPWGLLSFRKLGDSGLIDFLVPFSS
ncbi:hypothetical protein V6N12_050188 [Hibiscus sabdariffa]|uniref:RNase H type-1 domain-containing protein n=1 Tax=Hibiscus sabdariffa TaxID=183260 RepID=A0ABR2GCT9_9ROSI